MALNKGFRGRNITGGGGGGIRDAREVLRNKKHRPNTAQRTGGAPKRILKTSRGLVTNKKSQGISTAQLKNRQRQPKPATAGQHSRGQGAPTGPTVRAAMRRSTIINSNPVLQHALLDIAGALTARRNTTFTERKRLQRPVGLGGLRRSGHDGVPTGSGSSAAQQRQISARLMDRLDQRQDPPCSVLVSNLHANVSEADINELFRSMGPIVTAMFVSPGNALVTYHRKNDAVKAVETYHLRLLDGQPMTCVLLSPEMVPVKQQPAVPGR